MERRRGVGRREVEEEKECGKVARRGGGSGGKKLKRERETKTQAPRIHASSRPRITRADNSKDEGPCIFAGGEGERSTAPRLRSSAFAFVARGGRGKKEMRGLT